MLETLLSFINKYGYCISRTFNDRENHLLIYIDDEGYRKPNTKSFSWSCFFSAQFLNLLFGFNKNDLVLTNWEDGNLTVESFVKEFVPGTGFFFEVENHHFHIFYFDEDNLYLAHYDADADGYMFDISPIQKVDMIRFITDPTFRSVFLHCPEPKDRRYRTVKQLYPIFEIQVHKIEYIPSLNNLLDVIKQSHNLKSMIECFEENGDETVENVVNVLNQHMAWLENYISSM